MPTGVASAALTPSGKASAMQKSQAPGSTPQPGGNRGRGGRARGRARGMGAAGSEAARKPRDDAVPSHNNTAKDNPPHMARPPKATVSEPLAASPVIANDSAPRDSVAAPPQDDASRKRLNPTQSPVAPNSTVSVPEASGSAPPSRPTDPVAPAEPSTRPRKSKRGRPKDALKSVAASIVSGDAPQTATIDHVPASAPTSIDTLVQKIRAIAIDHSNKNDWAQDDDDTLPDLNDWQVSNTITSNVTELTTTESPAKTRIQPSPISPVVKDHTSQLATDSQLAEPKKNRRGRGQGKSKGNGTGTPSVLSVPTIRNALPRRELSGESDARAKDPPPHSVTKVAHETSTAEAESGSTRTVPSLLSRLSDPPVVEQPSSKPSAQPLGTAGSSSAAINSASAQEFPETLHSPVPRRVPARQAAGPGSTPSTPRLPASTDLHGRNRPRDLRDRFAPTHSPSASRPKISVDAISKINKSLIGVVAPTIRTSSAPPSLPAAAQ